MQHAIDEHYRTKRKCGVDGVSVSQVLGEADIKVFVESKHISVGGNRVSVGHQVSVGGNQVSVGCNQVSVGGNRQPQSPNNAFSCVLRMALERNKLFETHNEAHIDLQIWVESNQELVGNGWALLPLAAREFYRRRTVLHELGDKLKELDESWQLASQKLLQR